MGRIGIKYSEENTVRTETFAVVQTNVSRKLKILKSNDKDFPGEVDFFDTDGELIRGVYEPEGDLGVYYAMVDVRVTTLEQVQASKLNQLKESARSAIGKIDTLDDNPEEQKQVIVNNTVTIQDAELVSWA